MQKESKRCWASISGNPGKDTVHKPKGHRIRHQEEDECGVEGKLHFQASGESHLEYVGDFSRPQHDVQSHRQVCLRDCRRQGHFGLPNISSREGGWATPRVESNSVLLTAFPFLSQ